MQGTTEETAASSWYTACVASSSVLNTHPALCLLQRALQRDTEMHLVGAIETKLSNTSRKALGSSQRDRKICVVSFCSADPRGL